jgi:hypothetical protein
VVGLHDDGEELGGVRDARHRVDGGLRIGRMPRDAAERLDVVDAAERRRPDRVVRRRLRDGRQVLRILEPVERERGVGVRSRRSDRDRDEAFGELAAQLLIPLRSRRVRDHCDIRDVRKGLPPHAHVLVGARELLDHTLMLGIIRNLGNRRRADRRVRVLPSGLWLESIEE